MLIRPGTFLTLLLLLLVEGVTGQEVMKLTNPSFEDYPRASREPRAWYDCGKPGETPPDTHPNPVPEESFGVTKGAFHGDTYLGLVIRDNDTWEGVAQRLRVPLKKGTCYEFRLHLARSKRYFSQSRTTGEPTNYADAAKVRLWGGNGYCGKMELLDESAMVKNHEWKEYVFKFEPTQKHSYLMIEAFYRTPSLFPYNGNVLVDNASPIKVIPCDQEPDYLPMVKITKPSTEKYKVTRNVLNVRASIGHIKNKKDILVKVNGRKNSFRYNTSTKRLTTAVTLLEGNNRVEIIAKNKAGQASDKVILVYEPKAVASNDSPPPVTKPPPPADPKPFVATNTPELNDVNKIKAGQVIRIKNLYFDVDSYVLKKESFEILNEFYQFLNRNPKVVVEIGGHTNNRCTTTFCEELSENRAKAVSAYLTDKGIPRKQIQYKGYGKRHPIATNNTPSGRRKNQRVEIKILSMSG